MSSAKQSKILSSLYLALKPIVRMLLRAGIGYREFSEIAKAAYVDEASTGYGLRGRPTNISRIAVMTGISRKEIKQFRETSVAELSETSISRSPGAQVLAHWFFDPEYLDSENQPKLLEFEGGDYSFVDLVKKYGGDLPAGAVRTELIRLGAIVVSPDGKLKVEKREFVPDGLDDRLILGLDSIVQSVASTLDFNCDPENSEQLKIQQLWYSEKISEGRLKEVEKMARRKLSEYGGDFDSYITQLEKECGLADGTGKEVGVGMYYYEIPLRGEKI